jgi:hypothetical protein
VLTSYSCPDEHGFDCGAVVSVLTSYSCPDEHGFDCGAVVRVLTSYSCLDEHGFDPWSSNSNDYKIVIYSLLLKTIWLSHDNLFK